MASLLSMIVTETKAAIYARALTVAQGLGLTTTSWAPGDPTRSQYWYLAEVLETLEVVVAGYVKSGFLDHAEGDWLTVLADQYFNVTRTTATYGSCTVELSNLGGGLFVIAAGDVTVRSSVSGKTYRNTSGGTLASSDGVTPTTLSLTFEADEAGTDSNAAATEIDEMVNTLVGVTCSNTTACVGVDEEDDESLRDRCRAKLGMLSPNGPRDAYAYVVRSSDLTGVSDITRARVVPDSTTGDVQVYVAGASGAVAGGSVTAAQTAVETYAAPLCITPTVANATPVTVAVTYSVWLYSSIGLSTSDIEDGIQTALEEMFAARPIGGDIISPATTGKLYQSLIASTIKGAFPDHTFRVSVSAPAGDTSLAIDEVPVLGTVTPTVSLESDP